MTFHRPSLVMTSTSSRHDQIPSSSASFSLMSSSLSTSNILNDSSSSSANSSNSASTSRSRQKSTNSATTSNSISSSTSNPSKKRKTQSSTPSSAAKSTTPSITQPTLEYFTSSLSNQSNLKRQKSFDDSAGSMSKSHDFNNSKPSSSSSSSPNTSISDLNFTSRSNSTMAPVAKSRTHNLGQNQKQKPKKLVIKSFKSKPTLPPNFEQDTWRKLQNAVVAIFESRPVKDSLEELYKACENLCHYKYAPGTYNKLTDEIEKRVQIIKTELERICEIKDAESFIADLEKAWANHCRQMIMIRSIFLYLDRTYVLQTQDIPSLWDTGLKLFAINVMRKDISETHLNIIKHKTLDGIMSLIAKDRKSDQISRPLLKSLIRMFVDLNLYATSFEPLFLNQTEKFFETEGKFKYDELEVAEYLKYVEDRLQDEAERVGNYLDRSTRKPLIHTVENVLLERNARNLIDKGFTFLLDNSRLTDLSRLYRLFARVNSLDAIKNAFKDYVVRQGSAIVMNTDNDNTMVETLLQFKSKLSDIVEKSFAKDEQFDETLKKGFEDFINRRKNKPAELIAKYVDALLRSSNKNQTELEVEDFLNQVLILFRFIHGKDVFEAFYKKDLAKRLLLGKSASYDAEKSMLGKLKSECGAQFTTKLEGMFKDMELSKDLMATFRESFKYSSRMPEIDLTVHVLTQSYWPTYAVNPIPLPALFASTQVIFKDFYMQKHKSRKLFWANSLGSCVVRVAFKKSSKELSMSLYQTVVMLLFEDLKGAGENGEEGRLDYKTIKDTTGIEEKELQRTLQSLACGKIRVLTKHPKGKDINPADEFSFNNDFVHPLFRIKINTIQMKETTEEQTRTHAQVDQDRKYQIEAAIVRIMKTRKQLTHTQLVTELYTQLKFPVEPPQLKKQIESLIDREYLERDENFKDMYNYLA